jgi:hypothetical protein
LEGRENDISQVNQNPTRLANLRVLNCDLTERFLYCSSAPPRFYAAKTLSRRSQCVTPDHPAFSRSSFRTDTMRRWRQPSSAFPINPEGLIAISSASALFATQWQR